MTSKITLWGFSGSTYVRTIRMLLAEKGVSDYEQIPVNVLKGEPKKPEHLAIHPFGKVPVVEVDWFRVLETAAIGRYLNTVLPGPSLVPASAKDTARMDMLTNIIDSYAYGPLLTAVGYHLFPDFIGGQNEETHHAALEKGHLAVREIGRIKGDSPWLAGDSLSLADLYLAPIMAYMALTPHKAEFLDAEPLKAWWGAVSTLESFKATAP
ncbi:glutathione S-transferase family protein [Acidisoma silvae]|uniref:glutathione transferase n=1 Tax=Acidisoma silvae TaxID=2802396 RepID=A0A963YV11_9PROT|nr:glutathione S-transferase family protein [Acidisoma silvae]MCB8877585.1 glutathione S-transferase family protein [Acidisoma silvae]